MRDCYTKNDFWVRNIEDSKKYFIRLNGVYIEVSEDVFRVCYNSYRKELRDRRRDSNNISLDNENKNDHTLYDVIGLGDTPIHNVIMKERIDEIISTLDDIDQQIAKLYLYYDLSEYKIATRLDIKRSKVRYRKQKILKILQMMLTEEEWF